MFLVLWLGFDSGVFFLWGIFEKFFCLRRFTIVLVVVVVLVVVAFVLVVVIVWVLVVLVGVVFVLSCLPRLV